MDKIRYTISAELMRLAIWLLPDEFTKECTRTGLLISSNLILEGLSDDEE